MTDASSEELAISPAEWQVMKILWERGPSAARDVFAALPREANWSYQTAKTLLSRLVAKGAADYEQIGNSYLYRAHAAREQLTRREIRSLVERVVSGAASPVLAHFIDEVDLTEEDVRKIKKLLDEKRRTGAANPTRGRR